MKFQLIWKNSRQIGAAWAIREDKRLVLSIKYNPGGNVIGFFGKNVKPPTAQLLGPEWAHVPPKFARCPIATPTSVPTEGTASNTTEPFVVKGAAGMAVSSLELFIGSFILVALIS